MFVTGENNQHIHSLASCSHIHCQLQIFAWAKLCHHHRAITTCNNVIYLKSQAASNSQLGLNNQNVCQLTLGSQQSIWLEMTNDYPRQWNYKSNHLSHDSWVSQVCFWAVSIIFCWTPLHLLFENIFRGHSSAHLDLHIGRQCRILGGTPDPIVCERKLLGPRPDAL